MKKFLLSLGVLAAIAAPAAAAGRLDVEAQIVQPYTRTTAQAGVDYATTQGLSATGGFASVTADQSDDGHGAQGSVFGVNSH